MSFNLSLLKQATEVRFAKKSNVIDHPNLVFNKNIVHKTSSYKHLRLILDDEIIFKEHIDDKNSNIIILEMSYHFIPRSALQTTYTTFVLF